MKISDGLRGGGVIEKIFAHFTSHITLEKPLVLNKIAHWADEFSISYSFKVESTITKK